MIAGTVCVVGPFSGGGLGQGDGEAERLELADMTAGLAVGVGPAGVMAGAELAEAAAGPASRCQTITRMERATATRARSLPRRRTTRRYRSPRNVLVLAAAAAASPRAPFR